MLLPGKAFVRIVNNRLHAHPLRSSERRRMRRSKPALAALALMLLGANSYSQSETNKPRATDQSVQLGGAGSIVKGRAVFEDTGQPAPKQRVQLVAVDLLTNRRGPSNILTTLTDANGEFVFTRAAAGDYYVVAHPADEHVSGAESAPFPVQTGDASADAARLEQYQRDFPRITVSGAGPVEINLRVKNPHFGAISGHILDAPATIAPFDENRRRRFRSLSQQ